MKIPFKKAVHWGPNIVNIIEPSVFKSSTEPYNKFVHRQNNYAPRVRSFPESCIHRCKKKHSLKKDRNHGHAKDSYRDKRPATTKHPKKSKKGNPCVVKTGSNIKRLAEISKTSTHPVRCTCSKSANREKVKGHCCGRKHLSSAVPENNCKSEPRKCDKVDSKDKPAKVCKKPICEKPREILQKCKSTCKLRKTEPDSREVTQAMKIKGRENMLRPCSNHGLKVKLWLSPHPCHHR